MSQPPASQPIPNNAQDEFDKSDDEIREELKRARQHADSLMLRAQQEYEEAAAPMPAKLPSSSTSAPMAAFAFPPRPGKSAQQLLEEATQWVDSVWNEASQDAQACEQAFADLVEKCQAYERRRIEEGGWPARRGHVNALALNMWYAAEKRWRRANKHIPVTFQYTGTDSSEEDDDNDDNAVGGIASDDEDDESADVTDEVRKRRRRRAPPHPRRRAPLNRLQATRMRTTFRRKKNMMTESAPRSSK